MPTARRLITTSDGENGNRFIGDRGWIFVNRERIEASDPKLLDEPLPKTAHRLYKSNDHMGNFMDCIQSRKRCICDVEVGYRSVSVCHLGDHRAAAGHSALLGSDRRALRRPESREGQRHALPRDALAVAVGGLSKPGTPDVKNGVPPAETGHESFSASAHEACSGGTASPPALLTIVAGST